MGYSIGYKMDGSTPTNLIRAVTEDDGRIITAIPMDSL